MGDLIPMGVGLEVGIGIWEEDGTIRPKPGDIIVFNTPETDGTPITHRIVENHIADGEVITKGDANEQNDLSPVKYADILGKVQLTVPMLGYIASPLATLMGKIAMGCVIVGAYLLTIVGGRMKKK